MLFIPRLIAIFLTLSFPFFLTLSYPPSLVIDRSNKDVFWLNTANTIPDHKDKDKDKEGNKEGEKKDVVGITSAASNESHTTDHPLTLSPTPSNAPIATVKGSGTDRIVSSKDGNHVRLNGVSLSFVKVIHSKTVSCSVSTRKAFKFNTFNSCHLLSRISNLSPSHTPLHCIYSALN